MASFIVTTLTQNSGETDADFATRVQTFINDQNYYYVQVGGTYPTTRSAGNDAYVGYPPITPDYDVTVWDGTQNRRTVTFAYDNTYYYIYIGASPPLPPAPPFPTTGDLVMFGTGGTLLDTGFLVDTGSTKVDWNGYTLANLADGVNPQDAATVAQLSALVTGVSSVNAATGAVTLTVTDVGVGGTLAWSGTDLQIPDADGATTGLLTSADWTTFNAKQPAGNYITDLTGDVTASGPGSVAATIANAAVTFAKIQDLSGPSILAGRYTAGAGSMQEITLGTGISMSGAGVLSATGTGGTVTSVGLSMPTDFTVTGSPVTGAGTLTAVWKNTTANYVLAGPTTGVPATPAFRALVAADIPDLSGTYQPLSANLTSWAAITRASGFDTFVATPSSANLAAVVTDETGNGPLVFGTEPTISSPIIANNVGNAVGSIERDSLVFYGTPLSGATGVISTTMFSIVPAGGFNLSTATGVQSAFPTTGDVWTLNSNTSYFFEGMYIITKSGTTCTVAMAFALGGGASVTQILYTTISWNTGGLQTTNAVNAIGTVNSTVISSSATGNIYIRFSGIIRMNVGGTVTPQINFSASPTSPVMFDGSFIKFTPTGTDTNNTVGAVA